MERSVIRDCHEASMPPRISLRYIQATILVMPVHSRSKNGVASLACVAGVHDFTVPIDRRRGWPEQVRP